MRAVEIPFEPLTALAGGILGGAVVGVLAWRHLWKGLPSRANLIPPAHLTRRSA